MDAKTIYRCLEKDFIKKGLSDEWKGLPEKYTTNNFKKRSMGLVFDFTKNITKVYTAVFPETTIINKILKTKETDLLLFVHHPLIWDIRKKNVFHCLSDKQIQKLKDRRISIYNLHVPLDNYSRYSTSVTLAKELGVKIDKKFALYFGAYCGVIGRVKENNIKDLKKKFETILGHKSKLYKYGSEKISENKVAVVAGGGHDKDVLRDLPKDINVLVTGITINNNHSKETHVFSKQRKLNVLGGTHYSTEKFACLAMVKYFEKLGVPSSFVEGKPVMEDM